MFDEVAFLAFVAEQHERVRLWARALNVTTQDAEDIVQDALVCLWQNRERIERSGWPAWLWTAMVLRGRKHFRTRRRAAHREGAFAELLEEEMRLRSPETEMLFHEIERELRMLIDQLRPERREVVRLYLVEEIPMKDVAAQLGISVNTAQKRWVLAQTDMRATFERDRAKERFKRALAALMAFLLAAWSRLFKGRGRKAGVVLACAVILLVASEQDDWTGGTLNSSGALFEEVPSLRSDYTLNFPLSSRAERERDWGGGVDTAHALEAPRTFLARASAALQEGDLVVARSCIAQYRAAYPVDPSAPFAPQYALLVAKLAAH